MVLGLMMQHLLRVSQERNQPPVLRDVNRMYGARLDGEAKLRYVRREEGTIAEISINPLLAGGSRELAREIGQFVWRNAQDRVLLGVEVVSEDPLGAGSERLVVQRPFMPGTTVPTTGSRAHPRIPEASQGPADKAPATSGEASGKPAPPAAASPAAGATEPPRPRG